MKKQGILTPITAGKWTYSRCDSQWFFPALPKNNSAFPAWLQITMAQHRNWNHPTLFRNFFSSIQFFLNYYFS